TPHNFVVGQKVDIFGVSVAGYNGSALTIVAVPDSTHFTYTTASGLGSGSGGTVTNDDGGLRGLVADFSNPSAPVLYATTTNASQNRLVKLADNGDLSGNGSAFTYTTLATAPANVAFRGVALAPTAPGTTASTTTLSVSGSPANYGTGVN